MSHFTVLVIGEFPELQLAPYHEFECTGVDDEYVQDIDITDKVREKGLDWFGMEGGAVSSEDQVNKQGAHKYGYAIVVDGELVKAVRRTNPNAKWDYYRVGGRWTGAFKLKEGASGVLGSPGLVTKPAQEGYADQALKRDIDFEQMRSDAEAAARARWKKTQQITDGETWDSWDTVRARHSSHAEARTEYWEQPAMKLLIEAGEWEDDDLLLDEDAYAQLRRDAECARFAFLRDGIWTEQGKMGWWATVSDETDEATWNRAFNEMLDGLPDDTLLTVVDCHI